MRCIVSTVVVSLLMCAVCLAQAQDQPRRGAEDRPGRQRMGPPGGGMAPEVQQKFQQLRELEGKLAEAQRKAMAENPELAALQKSIVSSMDELANKIRELDQKVDDAVLKSSPDLAPTVNEKRAIIAEIEGKMGERKNSFWLMRMGRLFGMGMRGPGPGGPGPGGQGRRDAGPGRPPAPPAEQPK